MPRWAIIVICICIKGTLLPQKTSSLVFEVDEVLVVAAVAASTVEDRLDLLLSVCQKCQV